MDFLFSIPFLLYYFTGPTFWSSVSTSLNLLFFYMTWSTLVLTTSAWQIHLVGVVLIRLVFFLIPSLLTLLTDLLVPSLAKSMKIGGSRSLPPRSPRKIFTLVALSVGNLLLMVGLEVGVSAVIFRGTRQYPFYVTMLLPTPFMIFKNLCWMYLVRGLQQYFIHRDVLHSPRKSLHTRLHACHSHESDFTHDRRGGAAPYSLLTYADHPLPLLLYRFVPMFVSGLIVHPHLTSYFLFVFYCTAEETLSMSGYNTVPGFIMGGMVRRTAEHYMGRGNGNYGTLGVMDWLCDTSVGRDVMDDVRDEMEAHHVKEIAGNQMRKGIGMVTGAMQNGDDAEGEETRDKRPRRSTRSRS